MPKREYPEEEAQNLNLRSEEFREILGRPPRWMIRWGTTLIFLIIAIIITGSWLFKYPDVIPSQIVVTTENPPAPIVARSTGKIDHLLVTDKENVRKGQALAVIENTGDYRDVLELEEELRDFSVSLQSEETFLPELDNNYVLGEVQPQYALFLKRLEDYRHFIVLDYHRQKIASLREELERSGQYEENLKDQRSITEEEYELALRQFNRDSILFIREVIPEAEFEESESKLLNKRYALEQVEVSISNARIQLTHISQNILELQLQYKKEKNDLESELIESLDNLKAAIGEWRRNYYLSSPIDGTVTFTKYWAENQYVESGKLVMTVIPAEEGEIIGKMTLPFRGAGKVEVGQAVNIQFSNYPPFEYGMVRGIVRSISLIPDNQVYTLEVELPNGLTTFYGERLEFSQQMQGHAEIITRETTLLERIVRPLRYVMNKNLKD